MRLFVFGAGYTAMRLATKLRADGWQVAGTSRSPEGQEKLQQAGMEAFVFDGTAPMQDARAALKGATHILISTPPGEAGDPAYRYHGEDILQTDGVQWLGYLSTTGVYGNKDGAWVNEATEPTPTSDRGQRRLDAERAWSSLQGGSFGEAIHFRLPGIYGPGRSALDNILAGRTQRIDKPGQVFCRIHVDDIVRALVASMANPQPGEVYNIADDEPAPPQDVTAFAANLLGQEPAPLIPFEEADLSPMGRSFYAECKRVRNDKMKTALGVKLAFRTYREGLRAIMADMDSSSVEQ